ncbi:MAG: homoserine dehydrogenase [Muribaculaceae bacterium]|nr:homoserine dehydrogenase [Muribaculaceae bacterium]
MKDGKIQIGLFGLGTVGQGIFQVIAKARNAHAKIRRICVRDVSKPRGVQVDPALLTTDSAALLDDPEIDLIVEVIDDADASYDIVTAALRKGIPVVSGNKAMIARHLPELIELQRRHNTALLYDASSCGSIPVIRNLEEYYDNDLLLEVKGILNGSSNYILSSVFDHNEPYHSALAKAQQEGFAESDPTFDIEGFDSLFKLVIITVHALGVYVPPADIFTYGISSIHESDIRYAREKRVKIKLVAQVVKVTDEEFTMFVMPEFVDRTKYIYSVDDEYNGVVIRGECYDRQFMFGKGAGSLPTASSILSDIMARRHGYRYEYKKMSYEGLPRYTTDINLRVYFRYLTTDIPSLLPLGKIHEQYRSEQSNYIIADILLTDLINHRHVLSATDVFVCNIPMFFRDADTLKPIKGS